MYICTCDSNVSVVAVNGNIIRVGDPTMSSYVATRFGCRARVFEPCKGCVVACFSVFYFVYFHLWVQVSDIACHMIRFVFLMNPLYGSTVRCLR